MNQALTRSRQNVTNLVPRSPRNLIDRELQESINGLVAVRKSFDTVDKMVRKAFDLENSMAKRWLAQAIGSVMPKFMYDHLPQGVVTFIAEEYDVLELIEHKMRDQVNNAQTSLRNIANCAVAKKQDIEELRADLEQAKKENWDAQQIHQYITEKAGILVDPQVEQLLDEQFTVLSLEEREHRRMELFNQLEANTAIGDELCATLGKVCCAGLEVFDKLTGQYYDYVNVYKPLAVIRDSAKMLVDVNKSMYAAKSVVTTTFSVSIAAIEAAVDAASLVAKYQVASEDTRRLFQEGQKRITTRLIEMQKMNERTRVLTPAKVLEIPGSVIDVEPSKSAVLAEVQN